MNGSGCHSGDSVARQALKFLREQTPNPEIHLENTRRTTPGSPTCGDALGETPQEETQVLPGAGTHLEKYQNKPRLSHVWGHSWRSIRLKFLRGTNFSFSSMLGHNWRRTTGTNPRSSKILRYAWRSTRLKFLRNKSQVLPNPETHLDKDQRNKPQVLPTPEIHLDKHQRNKPQVLPHTGTLG